MHAISPFHWRRRVGMRDVDAWGIVWYGNYLAFCDEARAELFRAFGLIPGSFAEFGFTAPIVQVKSRYFSPARYDEEIDVKVRVHPPKGSKLTADFRIERAADGCHLSDISTTQVLVRSDGSLMYFMPEAIKPLFDRMLEEQAKAVEQ